jgi:hypothetical protein
MVGGSGEIMPDKIFAGELVISSTVGKKQKEVNHPVYRSNYEHTIARAFLQLHFPQPSSTSPNRWYH